MKMGRGASLWILDVLNNWIPPRIRDSRLLSAPLSRLLWGKEWRRFESYRDSAFRMTDAEYAELYSVLGAQPVVERPTDLNQACLDAVLQNVVGESVLDAGSGRGYLCQRLAEKTSRVVGLDYAMPVDAAEHPHIDFVVGSLTDMPFSDGEFDTVVSTHALEHVPDLARAVAELRRVARRRVIVVLPKERPYRWGTNLHCHFFPYAYSVQAVLGAPSGSRLEDLDDWFYVEDCQTA